MPEESSMKDPVYKAIELTGTSTTSIEDAVAKAIDPVTMLRADLENERITVGRYRERIRQVEAMGEFAVSETLRAIIVQEPEHEIDLAAALDINVPLPPKPADREFVETR
jgi:bacterioferritin